LLHERTNHEPFCGLAVTVSAIACHRPKPCAFQKVHSRYQKEKKSFRFSAIIMGAS